MTSQQIKSLAAQIVKAVAPSIETFGDRMALREIRPAPAGITRYEFENLMRRGFSQSNGDSDEVNF